MSKSTSINQIKYVQVFCLNFSNSACVFVASYLEVVCVGEFLGVVVSVFILLKNVLCLATGLSSAALNLFFAENTKLFNAFYNYYCNNNNKKKKTSYLTTHSLSVSIFEPL